MYQNDPFFGELEKDMSLGCALEAPRMNELYCISEYIYQSIIFENVYPELSEHYSELAMDEMKHYKMLSELQYRLGVNPTVNLRLSTKAINITEDRDSIAPRAAIRSLRNSVHTELDTANEYRKLAELACDATVKNFLLSIADDEDYHARLLTSLECSIITN